jgi:hypothetical protein
MTGATTFEYAIVRLVPRVDRAESINVGLMLFCLARDFLDARVCLDETRAHALWPDLDCKLVKSHLEAIPRICAGQGDAGPIARLSQRERWHWLVAPRSTILQISPVHTGLCNDPRATLTRLFDQLVCVP